MLLYATALALSLVGVDWHGTNPDENPGNAARVLTGDLTAFGPYYPPLLTYLIAIAYIPLYAVGRIASWWHGVAEFRAAYFSDRLPFYVTGRVVTAILAATLAPLTYLIARDARLGRWPAVTAGALMVILPGAVYWAHIAKSDVALAPSFLFVVLAGARFLDRPDQLGRWLLLGLAIAISVSVKQSAVFFIAPALLILEFVSIHRHGWRALRYWLAVGGAAIVFWIPLNIGILLNPRLFLDAQFVQAQMSHRTATFTETLQTWWNSFTSMQGGVPALAFLLWLTVPITAFLLPFGKRMKLYLLCLFFASFVGIVVICAIAGSRQPYQLMLPYASMAAVAVALLAAELLGKADIRQRAAGGVIVAIVAFAFVMRLIPIIREALVSPMQDQMGQVVMDIVPPGSRIMSMVPLEAPVPLSPEGPREMRARQERLAARYGMHLPPAATPLPAPKPGGYVVIDYPFVIGGLESVPPDKVKVLLPYAWPLQPEEWQLDYWLARGYRYHIFDPSELDSPLRAYRDFFRSIVRRCTELKRMPPRKPLYFESSLVLYRCD